MIQKIEGGYATNYIYDQEDRLDKVEDGQGGVIAT